MFNDIKDRDVSLTKYPRTPHLPESPGATSDDKWMSKSSLNHMSSGIDLVVTEKMDGSNLTMSRDFFFGRSLDSYSNAWDIKAKGLWGNLRYDIPKSWRLSGESLYARRSVAYDNLEGVYLLFGIWDETNSLIPWSETVEWAKLLNLPVVPVLYSGNNFDVARNVWSQQNNPETSEGFVIRNSGIIQYEDFKTNVVKYVCADHARTRADWRHRDDFALNTFKK